jgi:hypothetical protein
MLVRYCTAHLRHFGVPYVLGVRWTGWTVSTAGGLCEACRTRERQRWVPDPYGAVLIPVPVELGPRTLGRRVFVATLAATAAAVLTTAALLVVQPPDLIPSGGEPGLFPSGARLAEALPLPSTDQEMERPAASRPTRPGRVTAKVVTSRAAHTPQPAAFVATPVATIGAQAP